MSVVPISNSRIAGAVALVLDVLLLVVLGALAFLIVAGSGIYEPFGVRLKLRTANNPATIALVLALARVWLCPSTGFLWAGKPAEWLQGAHGTVLRFADGPTDTRVRRFLIGCVAFSLIARAFQAWQYPGFATGDDVEIHEMTLRALFGTDWPVWDLRSAFYPMAFIYPSQALAHAFGADDVGTLVFAGRVVVVLASTAAIWLTWVAARPVIGDGAAALAAALVAISKLHVSYGSSELPRPVAAMLLIGAFALLTRGSTVGSAILGGGLIGIAAALRFSEAVFVVPAVLHLWLEGRRAQAGALTAAAAVAAAAITAVADLAYWGSAFHSLQNAWEYTLVDRSSSRGFQPFHYYFTSLQHWTNWIVAGLAFVGSRDRALRPAALWGVLPIAILSALPHKESRYLIPMVPFIAICAGWGVARAVRRAERAAAGWRETVVLLLAAVVLYELGEWRLRRSNDGVALARYLRGRDPGSGVAVESLWRAGGVLYLAGRPALHDVKEDDIPRILDAPQLSWLALQAETVSRHRYEPMLTAAGWRRHAQFGEYDLFERHPRP